MIIIDDDGVMHKVLPIDALDKIRAEIETQRKVIKDIANVDDHYAGKLGGYNRCLKIIDKYREVSE